MIKTDLRTIVSTTKPNAVQGICSGRKHRKFDDYDFEQKEMRVNAHRPILLSTIMMPCPNVVQLVSLTSLMKDALATAKASKSSNALVVVLLLLLWSIVHHLSLDRLYRQKLLLLLPVL